jgi:hypothetical protein
MCCAPAASRPVADREIPTRGGGMYSTTADIASYVATMSVLERSRFDADSLD